MDFEDCFRQYLYKEYPELGIQKIDNNKIFVCHSELPIKFCIFVDKERHTVKSPDDIINCINIVATEQENDFVSLAATGYQHKSVVEILLNLGEKPIYRKLDELLKADATHYFAEDSDEVQEIDRLNKMEEKHPLCHIQQFWIGDIEVRIGKPSDVFRMLMNHYLLYQGETKESFNGLFSLKLLGVNNQNYVDYISQAFFIINQEYCCDQYPSVRGINDYISINYEFPDKIYPKESNHYHEAVFTEPFYLYNAGKTATSTQESFLYHYRVLEFFLYTLNTSKFIELLKKYNIAPDARPYDKNIIDFMGEIQKNFTSRQERTMISNAFRSFHNQLKDTILYLARDNNIIENPICKEDGIVVLADELYNYRNSIVHGKREKLDSISFPIPFADNRKAYAWRLIMEAISHSLIIEYCYNDSTWHEFLFDL